MGRSRFAGYMLQVIITFVGLIGFAVLQHAMMRSALKTPPPWRYVGEVSAMAMLLVLGGAAIMWVVLEWWDRRRGD